MLSYFFQVEIFGLGNESNVLDLLRFPCAPILSSPKKWRLQYWSHGSVHTVSSVDRKKLIQENLSLQFNELSIYAKGVQTYFCDTQKSFDFNATLHLSPTNKKWDSVWEYSLEDIQSEQRRMSYESQECSLRANDISHCPTLYEFTLPVGSVSNPDKILEDFMPTIANCLAVADIQCQYCGGLDLIPNNEIQINSIHTLAPWAKAYPMIGNLLDKPRPLTIAYESICHKIKNLLSLSDDSIIPVSNSGDKKISIVHIPQSFFEKDNKNNPLSSLLISRDHTTKSFETGGMEGEYKTSRGFVFVTLRRLNELISKKIMPRVQDDKTISLAIPLKYCKMLDIDPNDMIASIVNKQWSVMFENQLDLFYAKTPEEVNPRQRLLNAYNLMLKQTPIRIAYFELLKSLFLE
jgi:hypothetical protein